MLFEEVAVMNRTTLSMGLFLVSVIPGLSARVDAQSVDDFIRDSRFPGGLVVHLNAPDLGRTVAASEGGDFLVHGLYTESAALERARAYLAARRLSGRVTVSLCDGNVLPLVDNTVNLLIAENDGGVSDEEVLRVLAPRGRALRRQGDGWRNSGSKSGS